MIINFEGTDGCGKKTQSDLLYNYLINKGYKVRKLSFPNYDSASSAPVKMYLNGELGDKANCLSPYQANTLYATDRLITMSKVNIEDYDYIIMDRYVPSSMIHQSSVFTDKQDIDKLVDWIEKYEYGVLELPKPDIVLFLDLPVEISMRLASERQGYKSGEKVDILERDKEHLINAYNHAKYIAELKNWLTIDCSNKERNNIKTIEEIHQDILTKLNIKC